MERDVVVSLSGGVSSWAAARLFKDYLMEPGDRFHLLFADTLIEDKDTYEFLEAAAKDLDTPLTRVSDGRTPFQLFKDKKFIASFYADPCSRVLKRELLDKHCNEDYSDNLIRVVGITWSEVHRFDRLQRINCFEWSAPLASDDSRIPDSKRYPSKSLTIKWAEERGLPSQRLYDMGMPHANCGGGCVKAGISHWAKLYREFPERYKWWAEQERDVIEYLVDYGIKRSDLGLVRRFVREGTPRSHTPLDEFGLELAEGGNQLSFLNQHEWGGCGCAL